jgi:hypothetical protein
MVTCQPSAQACQSAENPNAVMRVRLGFHPSLPRAQDENNTDLPTLSGRRSVDAAVEHTVPVQGRQPVPLSSHMS